MILALRLAIEIALACHCARWSNTPHGWRCVAPLEHPRCELVIGWHLAGPGVPVCTKDCGGDS